MDASVKGKTATGYLWTYSHPKGQVVYRYHPGRGGKHARDDLRSFRGWLQTTAMKCTAAWPACSARR